VAVQEYDVGVYIISGVSARGYSSFTKVDEIKLACSGASMCIHDRRGVENLHDPVKDADQMFVTI